MVFRKLKDLASRLFLRINKSHENVMFHMKSFENAIRFSDPHPI